MRGFNMAGTKTKVTLTEMVERMNLKNLTPDIDLTEKFSPSLKLI